MNEKNKNILLAILIVGIISMTVAFAALTTGLKLQGTANVAETKWNVRFNNWALDTENTITVEGRAQQNTAVYPDVEDLNMSDDNNVTLVEGVNITLKQPGDYAKYTFEIVNEGTIAGKLNLFTPTITNNTNNVIGYTVGCYEASTRTGDAIAVNYVLGVNQRVYCDLKVEYKDVTNTQTAGQNQIYQQGEINTTITAEWQWVQDDSSSSNSGSNSGNEPGGNEPGGNEPGGNTPSNPYATDFSGTYQYMSTGDSTFGNTLDPNWNYYLRKNTTSNLIEACGVYGNQTVCITKGDYSSQFTSPSTGYIGGKDTEFTGTGAQCDYENAGLKCVGENTQCYIAQDDGSVSCSNAYGEENGCYIVDSQYYGCY